MEKVPQTKRFILDSWAVLAWLQGEPEGELVRDLIGWLEGNEEAKRRAQRLVGEGGGELQIAMNIINLDPSLAALGPCGGRRGGYHRQGRQAHRPSGSGERAASTACSRDRKEQGDHRS